jgi:ubiquinone biosynthesis accessory factor UbiK
MPPTDGAVHVLHCARHIRPAAMTEKRLLDELGERLAEAARNTPAQDIEKNLRALLVSFFDRFDLVPREDFEVQKKLLERAQARLAALEARLAELESQRAPKSSA